MHLYFRLLAAAGACALALIAQQPKKTAALAKPAPAAPKKSALDKATFEAYVRHLFVWGPQIKVEIDDPKPSSVPGFFDVNVRASAGAARQDELFYVSKDGQKILRGTMYDVANNPFKPDLDKLKTEFQPSFGAPGAPVVLVVFSDFQCPYCKEEAKLLRTNLPTAYPKQVRLYFKDYPLEQIHVWSKPAAIAGRCIFRQNPGAFWEYHDWMFEHQTEITAENLKAKVLEFAKGKEIDTLQLTRCMETKATEAEVAKSVAEAQSLKITGTPALFVNGRRIPNGIGWPELRQVIDYEIEYQKTARNAGEDCGCEVKLPAPGLTN